MAFESLSEKLQGVINKLKGKTRVTEEDIKEIAREVKLALLEADVNYKIVTSQAQKNNQYQKHFRLVRNTLMVELIEFMGVVLLELSLTLLRTNIKINF